MRPSNSLYFFLVTVLICCREDDPVMPDLVELKPVTEITSNSAKLNLEIVGTVVQLTDTTFLIDDKVVKEVGFAYSTDPKVRPWHWENISVRPTTDPAVTVVISNLESNTKYYVSAFVRFHNDPMEQRVQQQVMELDFSNENIEFVTLE